jgi:hypothetical protein
MVCPFTSGTEPFSGIDPGISIFLCSHSVLIDRSIAISNKEAPMDVKDFCSAMESEMTAWKAKMYDAMRKIDKLGSAEKEKILMNVQDLNMIMDDMAQRVEQLRTECPSDWSPVKTEIEQGSVDMRGKYDETMEAIGKASPVSIAG